MGTYQACEKTLKSIVLLGETQVCFRLLSFLVLRHVPNKKQLYVIIHLPVPQKLKLPEFEASAEVESSKPSSTSTGVRVVVGSSVLT